MTAETTRKLVYFADPMCSWCYGFSPVITGLAEHFAGRLGLEVVMGGLRPGTTEPMREKDRDYIRGAWTRVAAASGQHFNHAFFDRERFVYDTEPACRAVVTMRRRSPGQALPYLARVSRAFYAENQDVTDAAVLARLAGEFGETPEAFAMAMLEPEARNETFRDFMLAQQLGIQGYPAVIAGSETQGYALLTSGYQPLEPLREGLERWLSTQQNTIT